METKKLTPRQWWLYDFVKKATSSQPGKWLSQDEIVEGIWCDLSYCHDDKYEINENPRSHDRCILIWLDVEAINKSPEVDKVILVNDHSYKMAVSYEEADTFYLGQIRKRAIASLVRYSNAKRKCKADGQGKLLSLDLKPIDEESKAKAFIEAYVDENK